jgi:ABC-type sugar transport system permease subunit
MNLPSGLCLLLILAWPVLYAGWLSIHDVSLRHLRTGDYPFAGLGNYVRLFGDEIFWLALRNTVVFVGVSVALEVVIALAVALVIDDDRVGLSRVTRVLLLVPWGVPPVVNGLLWAFIFNTQFGYLNRALFALGLIQEPVLRTTFGFMVFDEIFAITQGGPGNATWVASWYTYRAAFQPPFNVGLSAASAWVMALILAVAGVAYARMVGRRLEA